MNKWIYDAIITLALGKYPGIETTTLRVIPTLCTRIEVIDAGNINETIIMDWLPSTDDPMDCLGYGSQTNTLIVHRSMITWLQDSMESEVLKKIPIDDAPAGLEMDAALAKALGWSRVEIGLGPGKRIVNGRNPDGHISEVPGYSTDIDMALHICRAFLKIKGVKEIAILDNPDA
jgi:hypothetical protein